ncbi:hypothetical protein, partial [Shewanella baltica]|uniref:hypothetical protein n=1 Tax=Shewanella baltica TaxID=62322 RepID=UPI00217E344A
GCIASSWLFYSEVLTRLMGKLIGDADQICGYGFSSTYLGNKAVRPCCWRPSTKAFCGDYDIAPW